MAITRGAGRRGTFVGRRTELEVMAKLVSAAREGRSGAVVLRAAAGLGKTYLLERVADEYATDMQVLAINGIEAESVFDYAALQRLCSRRIARIRACGNQIDVNWGATPGAGVRRVWGGEWPDG